MAHGTESTRHRQPGNKCPSIPFQNLMKTSIFIKSKGRGSTAVRFTELLQKAGETMTKIQAIEREPVNSRTR